MANQYTERIAEETPPQEFMGLPSKTASQISGTDYMMMVNNSEAYKALVDDVAEAIMSKLTSKSFSGLETTAKNVIGALNELNSKTQSFYTEGSESTSAIPVKQANKYFCVAAPQGTEGLSKIAIVFVLEISNDFKKTNIINICGTALSVSVKLNDGAVTFTFGSTYTKLLMINIDHA